MNLNIKPLEGNEQILLSYLDDLEQNYKGKSLDWIPYLRRDWEKYIFWTLCFDEKDSLVAFSCIQDHFFEPGVVRILTRTWFDPNSRFAHGALWRHTPVAPMARAQIEWLQDNNYKKAIFTLESFRDFRVLEHLCKKINTRTGITSFVPQTTKIKTHPWQEPQDYQWYAEHLL
tara:strand:+ start:33 stop:551 length:519 start_codon:yes stop_codon:yes gene_type:complete